jgi:endonuclease V-like protein UPF0215 family
VGTVYRGNKALDGVFAKRGESSLAEIISGMLTESRHFGQIRLILLDDGLSDYMGAAELWENTGKPVLKQVKDDSFDSRHMFLYKDRVFLATGIDEASARRALDVIYGDSECEALRIAGIILRGIGALHNV